MTTRWDDIIFAQRNKEYGAYRLRKAHTRILIISTVAACLLFVSPAFWLYHRYNSNVNPRVGYLQKYTLYDPSNYNDVKQMDQIMFDPYRPEEENEDALKEQTKSSGENNASPVVVTDSLDTDDMPVDPTGLGKGEYGSEAGREDGNIVYDFVEEMPLFPGGEEGLREYIAKNTKFPEYAWKNRIRGTVYVTFIIDEEGNVGHVEIIKSVHPSLDDEVIRVINSLPRWKPGSQQGRKVRVRYNLPVNFL